MTVRVAEQLSACPGASVAGLGRSQVRALSPSSSSVIRTSLSATAPVVGGDEAVGDHLADLRHPGRGGRLGQGDARAGHGLRLPPRASVLADCCRAGNADRIAADTTGGARVRAGARRLVAGDGVPDGDSVSDGDGRRTASSGCRAGRRRGWERSGSSSRESATGWPPHSPSGWAWGSGPRTPPTEHRPVPAPAQPLPDPPTGGATTAQTWTAPGRVRRRLAGRDPRPDARARYQRFTASS